MTIHELTVFGGPHQPPSGAFTASGLPWLLERDVLHQVIWFSPSGARIKSRLDARPAPVAVR